MCEGRARDALAPPVQGYWPPRPAGRPTGLRAPGAFVRAAALSCFCPPSTGPSPLPSSSVASALFFTAGSGMVGGGRDMRPPYAKNRGFREHCSRLSGGGRSPLPPQPPFWPPPPGLLCRRGYCRGRAASASAALAALATLARSACVTAPATTARRAAFPRPKRGAAATAAAATRRARGARRRAFHHSPQRRSCAAEQRFCGSIRPRREAGPVHIVLQRCHSHARQAAAALACWPLLAHSAGCHECAAGGALGWTWLRRLRSTDNGAGTCNPARRFMWACMVHVAAGGGRIGSVAVAGLLRQPLPSSRLT